MIKELTIQETIENELAFQQFRKDIAVDTDYIERVKENKQRGEQYNLEVKDVHTGIMIQRVITLNL